MSVLAHQKKIEIDGKEITVRDLPWPVMKQFLDKLSQHVKGLVGESVGAAKAGAAPAAIGASFLEKLPAVVINTTELAEFLVTRTIHLESGEGRLEISSWLQQRSSTEFMALLDAALEVTFNEEFVSLGKAVAGRVSSAFSLATPAKTASPKHVISSSGKDGPGAISSSSPSPNSAVLSP
jgi:hypothetical protein